MALDNISLEFDALLTDMQSQVLKTFANSNLGVGYQFPLRPRFFTRKEINKIEETTHRFLTLLLQVPKNVFANDIAEMSKELRVPDLLSNWLIQNFELNLSSYSWARPDLFLSGPKISFIEQNLTTGIGGFAFIEQLNAYFETHPVIVELKKRHNVKPLSVIDGIKEAFELTHAGKKVGYLDALVPETGLPYDMEGEFLVKTLQEKGFDITSLEKTNLEYKNKKLLSNGKSIDIILRNFPGVLLRHRLQELAPVLQACREKQALMIETPFDMILMNKLLLVYVSDPKYKKNWSGEDWAFLQEIVPWTRALNSEPLRALEENRNNLVIKKGLSWQGRAVYMGSSCTKDEWVQCIKEATKDGDWIVQEMAPVELVSTPFYIDDKIKFKDVLQLTAPFMMSGKLAGFSCRNNIPDQSNLISMHQGRGGRTTAYVLD